MNKIKVGDIVLIGSDLEIKPFWHLARVVELLPGKDSKVRSARVVRGNRTEAVYPLCKLYPLELSLHDARLTPEEPKEGREESPEIAEENSVNRLKRLAAKRCQEFLKRICN